MEKLQKTVIYWGLFVAVVVFSVFLMVITNQKLNTATTTNTVSFSGQGKAYAKPDVATVDFSVLTEAKTSKAAQDENSKRSQKIVEYLKGNGLQEKDIKTTYYNIYPQYSPIRPHIIYDSAVPIAPNIPQIVGYQATQGFQIKIRDFDKISDVVDGLVANGANNITNLAFSIEDPERLRSEARTLAIADAKKKADELKGKIGIKLGKIINFYEDSYGYPLDRGGYGSTIEAQVKGPAIPPGESEITINVNITYQIK